MKHYYCLGLIIFWSLNSVAQPVSDGNGQTSTGNTVSSLTISDFSVPGNDDRLLVVCTLNSSNAAAPALAFDGTPMLSALSRSSTSGLRISMFYLALGANVSAASGDVVATGTSLLQLGAVSFHGVNQSDPVDGGVYGTIVAGSSTAPGLTVTSNSSKLVCDCVGAFASGLTGFTANDGQTLIRQSDASSPNTRLAMSTKPGTASTNIGWTINGDFTGGTATYLGLNIAAKNTLPVRFIRFTGKATEGTYQLSWQTTSEVDNSGFFIERSPDGQQWKSLDFVRKSNSTGLTRDYTWPDGFPLAGANYYRLKQVDMDGSFSYSSMIVYHQKDTPAPFLYPNPVQDILFYKYGNPGELLRARIFDASGKLVSDGKLVNGQFPVSDLPVGYYQFVLTTGNGNLRYRFLKQ